MAAMISPIAHAGSPASASFLLSSEAGDAVFTAAGDVLSGTFAGVCVAAGVCVGTGVAKISSI